MSTRMRLKGWGKPVLISRDFRKSGLTSFSNGCTDGRAAFFEGRSRPVHTLAACSGSRSYLLARGTVGVANRQSRLPLSQVSGLGK